MNNFYFYLPDEYSMEILVFSNGSWILVSHMMHGRKSPAVSTIPSDLQNITEREKDIRLSFISQTV